MSVFNEFRQAWAVQFPGEDLPAVWEEDTRANLIRHQQKLEELKLLVKKEEFYVKFLEKALADAKSLQESASHSPKTSTSTELLPENSKPDFVTVISISNEEESLKDESKSVTEKPRAPPKPLKQYSRSVSADNPSKSQPVDVVAWTKQQIQQLQTKQLTKVDEVSSSSNGSSNYENIKLHKHASSNENAHQSRIDYENVFDEFPAREADGKSKDFRTQQSLPTTDLDSELGRVKRATAFFQQQQPFQINPNLLPGATAFNPPSKPPSCDPYYDTVPREEHRVDAENYAYVLEQSEDEDKETKKEGNGTLTSFSSTISDDSSNGTSSLLRLYANVTSLDDIDGFRSPTAKEQAVLQNFFDSEEIYVGALSVCLQYSKALTLSLSSSQPIISKEEINCIFFHIPQLYSLHSEFLQKFKATKLTDWNLIHIAQLLKDLSKAVLPEYAVFLANYTDALETIRKASQRSPQFCDLTRQIKCRSAQQQTTTIEDLLHKPVARIQCHVAVIKDLLECAAQDDPAYPSLMDAHKLTKTFLSEFSTNQLQSLFPTHSSKHHSPFEANRHLVKNGFLVELQSDGKRKQRHCFLFTDLIVCTKYKITSGATANVEVKWFLPLALISLQTDESASRLSVSALTNVASLRSQAAAVRTQMERSSASSDKQRKKLATLEAKLLLDSPNLPLKFVYKPKGNNNKATQTYTFLLSSEFERTLWVEAVETLKRNIGQRPPVHLQSDEVENHVKACRTAIEPPNGFSKTCGGPALSGELQVVVHSLKGLQKPTDVYVVIELDSYGHYFHKVRTKMVVKSAEPHWEEDFNVELEGTRGLRILLYEEDYMQVAVLKGKAEIELTEQWLKSLKAPQYVKLTHQLSKACLTRNTIGEELTLCLTLRYLTNDLTLRRPPQRLATSSIFNVPIEETCQREKRQIPYIISCCVREIERRGLEELGIYRVSGLTTDINKLRKAFDTRGSESDSLLKDVDINSVSGLLKSYLRQLPEALFTDRLYPHFLQAFSTLDVSASLNGAEDIAVEGGARTLTQLFSSLPQVNQKVIVYLLEHLVRVNSKEVQNKMSLHNLATVFGPTLLRPAPSSSASDNADLLSMSTMDVMAQAGILHFFLLRSSRRLPIQQS